MGIFLKTNEYNAFTKTLKGPLETLKGEIFDVHSETFGTFGCTFSIVIHESSVTPTIISDLMKEIASKFRPMYDKYTKEYDSGFENTMVRIRGLMFTGGLDVDINYIGIDLNNAMTTVLPVEKLQWTKEPHTVNDLIQYTEAPEVLQLMKLDETTLEKFNRSLRQLQSQKNVPHNLRIHLDFIEEGTFMLNDLEVKYKLPENIELVYKSDPRNHNKITGIVDFDFMPIHVEYPMNPTSGKNMYDTLTELLTAKFISIFKSNDLVPDRYSANSNKSTFNYIIKFTG
jgi:hypothetical protein